VRYTQPWIVAAAISAVGIPTFCCLAWWLLTVPDIPSFDDLHQNTTPSDALLLDRHGLPLAYQRIQMDHRRLEWLSLTDISPHMAQALTAAEDQRFYRHHGVDWFAVGGALREWVNTGRLRGASTLTMQLASLVDDSIKPAHKRRSFRQKWRQMRLALAYERQWSKAQILEAYMNQVPFRGELEGITAAAYGLFDKHPSALTLDEAWLLASAIAQPGASAARLHKKACRMARKHTQGIASKPCDLPPFPDVQQLVAPVWHAAAARAWIRPDDILLSSTLDRDLQTMAERALHEQLLALRANQVNDGAVVVLDNSTGDILAYVGGSGELSPSPFIDAIRAPRQPGSTLKPFLYELALEQRLLTAASLLKDAPVALQTSKGTYAPSDYESHYHGLVTLRTALAGSLNIPAVRTIDLVGIPIFANRLQSLRLNALQRPALYYGHALALGSGEVNLLELTNAYRSLANHGDWSPTRHRLDDPVFSPESVMDENAVFIITDILSDRSARAITFGLENPLSTSSFSAVKTGTSQGMRDNWCIGYSDRYSVGVWVGNLNGEPMRHVSGISGAAPVWRSIMNALHKHQASQAPYPPNHVERIQTNDKDAKNQGEWFISGTAPIPMQTRSDAQIIRIESPVHGSIFAWDPEIDPQYQRLMLRASGCMQKCEWRINERPFASGAKVVWKISRGEHRIDLYGPGHKLVDTSWVIVK